MSFSSANIASFVLEQAFEGLQSEVTSFADEACTKIPVDSTTGTLQLESSITGLASSKVGLIAEGAAPDMSILDMATTSYQLGRATGFGSVVDGIRDSLANVNYDAVERAMRKAMKDAARKLDSELNTRLSDTSVNKSQAASAVWTASTTNVIGDFQAAARKCGYGDTLILGGDVLEALQVHPDFTSETANFSGGSLPEGEVLGYFQRKFPYLQNVIFGRRMYNSANPGQAISLDYEFDGLAWIGHKRDLLLLEMGSGATEQDRDIAREATLVRFTRRVAVLRPHTEMGCVITGVIA